MVSALEQNNQGLVKSEEGFTHTPPSVEKPAGLCGKHLQVPVEHRLLLFCISSGPLFFAYHKLLLATEASKVPKRGRKG